MPASSTRSAGNDMGAALHSGLTTHAPLLEDSVSEHIEQKRYAPAGFASLRYLRHASAEELMRSTLPDVRNMAMVLAQSSMQMEEVGRQGRTPLQWDGSSDWRCLVEGAPTSSVRLSDIVPKEKLDAWTAYMSRTQNAFDAIRAGRPHRHPGDFVIQLDELPEWAQQFVWDTGNPEDCRPVLRSDRHTAFPGVKQFDRERIREIAAHMGWHSIDPDIVRQAGEGGFELQSAAPLHTTAVWHHSGVVQNFQTADEAVRYERQQAWTSESTSPLPFVPSVFSPRDVVWQERIAVSRVVSSQPL